ASGGVRGHVEVQDASSPMVDRKPNVEKMEADRRHEEEAHPSDQVPVITQKGEPTLIRARIGLRVRQIARDRGEAHVDPELRQLGLDLPGAPGILGRLPSPRRSPEGTRPPRPCGPRSLTNRRRARADPCETNVADT